MTVAAYPLDPCPTCGEPAEPYRTEPNGRALAADFRCVVCGRQWSRWTARQTEPREPTKGDRP